MPALLFAVAMGLHIFATDNVLAEHFPVRLTGPMAVRARRRGAHRLARRRRRSAHRNSADQHVDRVLGGAILLNVFIDELSPERHSGFGWVVAGLVVYALLLIFATVAGKPGAA